jgi:uncharacterized protein (TIGR02996 family)
MTADERALIQTIIANPDDDLPRLVYADWLEEHGRAASAELFRCEGHRAGGEPKWHTRLPDRYPDLANRLVYIPGSTPEVIAAVRLGVVFFMAWWSGPAIRAFAELAKVIRECDPDGRLLIVVLDVDGLSEEYEQELRNLGPFMMGCGQAIWVRNGRMRHANQFGLQTDCLKAFTTELLETCDPD